MKKYGYIKLDRDIIDWAWNKDAITFFVFVNLVLRANYSEKPFLDKTIKRGQLVIGRKKLAEMLNLSEQNIRTALKHLISTGDITTERCSKFTIITINNYDDFQLSTNLVTTSLTNSSPTNNQMLTNNQPQLNKYNKYNKNNKNNKSNNITSRKRERNCTFSIEDFEAKSLFND